MAEGALLKLPRCSQGDKASGKTARRVCPLFNPPCSAPLLFGCPHPCGLLPSYPKPTKEEEWLQFRKMVAGSTGCWNLIMPEMRAVPIRPCLTCLGALGCRNVVTYETT